MKVLFVGGTGLISSACSELAVARGIELWLLNRAGSPRYQPPQGANTLTGDVHGDEGALARLLEGHTFDAVVDWIAFTPDDIERDIRLFSGRTRQFVFISSASAYQTPPEHYLITEQTPLVNPFWQYSRDKIACEQRLMDEYRRSGFPVTIVRPSHTYGPSQLPFAVGSWQHPYTVLARVKRGDPIIVHGDGTSLWIVTWNADLAVGLVGLLGRDDAVGEAFQITSDEVLTWNQITAEIGAALGVEPIVVHIPSELIAAYDADTGASLLGDKTHSVVFDNTKIKHFVPDFDCKVPFREGVRRAIAWFEADPARRSIDVAAEQSWDAMIAAYARAAPRSG